MNPIKYLIAILFIFLLFPLDMYPVAAESTEQHVEDIMVENISLNEIESFWDELINEYGGFIPELKKTTLREFLKNNDQFSLKSTINGLLKYLGYELILNGKLLGSLLLLTLFSVILQTMHTAFEKSVISKIAYFVVYIVLIFIALNSFYLAFSYAKQTIDVMSSFMVALIPLVLGLMASFGNLITVSFFHPIIILFIYFSGFLVSKIILSFFFFSALLVYLCGVLLSNIILPLLFLSALLLIVSSLSENYQVTHLANLFRSVGLGILGGFLTIFLGVMSVQGAASAIQDGVAMKTAKFITGNFIPVIGRTFTDATDTILSASLLLKNAVGIVGVIIIVFIALFPTLKIFAIALTYKVAAAILQPIGDGPVIESLNTISKYILYILGCLLVVTLMFFLAIVIITIASNVILLLR